jgi:hypothetical protein
VVRVMRIIVRHHRNRKRPPGRGARLRAATVSDSAQAGSSATSILPASAAAFSAS